MTPSTEQLAKWCRVSDDGSEVTLPASAWLDALWMLRIMESIEDNTAVRDAFAAEAERRRTGA